MFYELSGFSLCRGEDVATLTMNGPAVVAFTAILGENCVQKEPPRTAGRKAQP